MSRVPERMSRSWPPPCSTGTGAAPRARISAPTTAYRLYERADWHTTFGSFAEPYRDDYFPDPFSTSYVRHVLGWYAQKHPDEDFAETFAVWLTPQLDWRAAYEGWGALDKLQYVDRVMSEIGSTVPDTPEASEDDDDVE